MERIAAAMFGVAYYAGLRIFGLTRAGAAVITEHAGHAARSQDGRARGGGGVHRQCVDVRSGPDGIDGVV